MKNEMTLSLLRSELRNFGLNPTDWTVKRVKALNFIIQNRHDESFSLWGRLEFQNRRPRWKSLEVVSL